MSPTKQPDRASASSRRFARALALSLSSINAHTPALSPYLLVLRMYMYEHQDNAQQFKFGLAYYNLARMLGLQGLWEEAL